MKVTNRQAILANVLARKSIQKSQPGRDLALLVFLRLSGFIRCSFGFGFQAGQRGILSCIIFAGVACFASGKLFRLHNSTFGTFTLTALGKS